ncbi:MAG: hypothetical protein ACAH07_01940 [Methylophilaceae bacterium]|nr:hypothetical protein [Methyloradius sp.]
MPINAKIIYIEFGDNKRYKLELLYSLATLLKHNALEKSDVIIYTETPDFFKSVDVTVVSIKDRVISYSKNWSYTFRVKPCVILDVLNEFSCPILFLDTDTIIHQNLTPLINSISRNQVFLNRLEKINPYPSIQDFSVDLPHSGKYEYNPLVSWMYNSGIIGVSNEHIPVFEDSIYLLDSMRSAGINEHTIEQTALSEILRINKINIGEVLSEISHYCRGAEKEFMAHQLYKKLADWDDSGLPNIDKPIKLSYLRARLFKRLGWDFG